MKSGKEKNKEKNQNTTVRNFQTNPIRRRGVKVSQTEQYVVHSEPMSSPLREVCCYSKIISTEKISRNNNNTVT